MVGCQNIFEDNDTTLDGSKPYNTIASPVANQIFKAGEGIRLSSDFTDKDQVAEVNVEIVALGSDLRGSVNVVNFKRYPKQQQFKLDTAFAGNTFAPGNYQLRIRSVDTRNNEGVQEVKFAVN